LQLPPLYLFKLPVGNLADRANVWQLVPDKDEPANGTDINAGIGKKGVSFFLVPSKE
jgi:hypothetical protein